MPGPLAKDPAYRARRNRGGTPLRELPAGGYDGPVPRFPLGRNVRLASKVTSTRAEVRRLEALEEAGEATAVDARKLRRAREDYRLALDTRRESAKLERALWRELWRSPQASAWAEQHVGREVAGYARWSSLAELGDLPAQREARQLADRLGLNSQSVAKLRWSTVGPAEVVPLTRVTAQKRYSALRVTSQTTQDAEGRPDVLSDEDDLDDDPQDPPPPAPRRFRPGDPFPNGTGSGR